MDESSDEEHADGGLFECALAELLAEGVADDVRPTLQNFRQAPAKILQACGGTAAEKLPISGGNFPEIC